MRPGVAWVLVAALCTAPVPAAAKVLTRVSTAEIDAGAEWQSPGFRLSVSGGYERLFGLRGSPEIEGVAITFRPGWQLDHHWLLGGLIHYTVTTGDWPLGARWFVGPSLEFFPWRGWSVHAAIGYAGMSMRWSAPDDSFATPEAGRGGSLADLPRMPPIPVYPEVDSCEGHAVGGVFGTGYRFAIGELFSTGPSLQADAQWTRCRYAIDTLFDPSTGAQLGEIAHYRWWTHLAVSASWVLVWR